MFRNEDKLIKIIYPTVYEVKEKPIVETEQERALKIVSEKMEKLSLIKDKKEWFIEYKNLMNQYIEILDTEETIYEIYTEEEIYLIQRCVETECFQGDFESKCNVASVIFNRLYNGNFGNNIEEVITAKNQFTYSRKEITEDTKLAVEYAFGIEDTTNGCLAFHSNEKNEKFGNWNYEFTDSIGHHFYK